MRGFLIFLIVVADLFLAIVIMVWYDERNSPTRYLKKPKLIQQKNNSDKIN
jgi:hypothetical protein